MKIKDITLESLSKILYHKTSLVNAFRILESNKFLLTPSIYHKEEEKINPRRNYYYLSTSRSKISGYYKDDTSGVIFTLDGDLLSKNYSGTAVDYWGKEFRDITPDKFESEDRLFSKKPEIPNAAKYIKSIHILNSNNKSSKKIIEDIVSYSQKMSIPCYVYEDQKAWLTQNKNKVVSVDTSDSNEPALPPLQKSHMGSSTLINNLYELLSMNSFRDLSYDSFDLLKQIQYKQWGDIKTRLKVDFNSSKKSREETALLTREMNKLKLKTLDDVFNYILKKNFHKT
jgi:hypothetical protein